MRILLIDDESLARNLLKQYLKNIPDVEVCGECSNGFEGVKAVHELTPDLILLDIQMPKLTGFEMLELIENPPPVIFVTAYDEYAIQAFEVNAVGYLLKPVSEEKLHQAIEKVRSSDIRANYRDIVQGIGDSLERVVLKNGNNIIVLPLDTIVCLEALDDYVQFLAEDGSKYLKKQTLKFYEEKLPAGKFVRIHRSFMVPVAKIIRLEPMEKDTYRVTLQNGIKLPVSKSGYLRLKEIWQG